MCRYVKYQLCIVLLTCTVVMYGQERIKAELSKVSFPSLKAYMSSGPERDCFGKGGWISYKQIADHYWEGELWMKECVTDTVYWDEKTKSYPHYGSHANHFYVKILTMDSLIVNWKIGRFLENRLFIVDSYYNTQYHVPFEHEQTDTLNIEQYAFDYYLEKFDSIPYFDDVKPFNRSVNKIYFNGHTISGGMPLNVDKLSSQGPRKRQFVIVDSNTIAGGVNNNLIFSSPVPKQIKFTLPYVRQFDGDFRKVMKHRDICLSISNRMYYNRYYYVMIAIEVEQETVSNRIYIKLDEKGKAIDWISIGGIS